MTQRCLQMSRTNYHVGLYYCHWSSFQAWKGGCNDSPAHPLQSGRDNGRVDASVAIEVDDAGKAVKTRTMMMILQWCSLSLGTVMMIKCRSCSPEMMTRMTMMTQCCLQMSRTNYHVRLYYCHWSSFQAWKDGCNDNPAGRADVMTTQLIPSNREGIMEGLILQ